MVKEAEEMAETDKKRREEADLKNDASNLAFQTKKSLEDLKDNVDPKEKEEAESLIANLEEALKGEDIEAIRSAKEALEKVAQSIAQKAYQQAQQTQQDNTDPGVANDNNSGDDNPTVDAEFESKD
jgi:molecular chaperone DnaK